MATPDGNWIIDANGYKGNLNFTLDAQGNINSGTVYGEKITGFWDDAAQRLTFIRIPSNNNPSSYQIYTGFLMSPQPPDSDQALAGSFEAFAGTGAIAQRPVYGWYATPFLVS